MSRSVNAVRKASGSRRYPTRETPASSIWQELIRGGAGTVVNSHEATPNIYAFDVWPYALSDHQKQEFRDSINGRDITEESWHSFFNGISRSIGSALSYRDAAKQGSKKRQEKAFTQILEHLDAVIEQLSDGILPIWAKWNLIDLGRTFEFDESYFATEIVGEGYVPVEKMRRRKTSLSRAFSEIVYFRNLVVLALDRVQSAKSKNPERYKREIAFGVALHMKQDLRVSPTVYKNNSYARALDVALQIVNLPASKGSGRKALMQHGLRLLKGFLATGELNFK